MKRLLEMVRLRFRLIYFLKLRGFAFPFSDIGFLDAYSNRIQKRIHGAVAEVYIIGKVNIEN